MSRFHRMRRLAPRMVPMALGLVVMTTAGCPWPWGQNPEPSGSTTPSPGVTEPTPTPPATAPNRQVFVSGAAIVNGMLSVKTLRAGTQDRLAGCTISLSGPTPAWGITDSSQDLRLDPLEAGTYAVTVAAPGFATRLVEGVAIAPQSPVLLTVELTPQAGQAVGRVVDQGGAAIAGARISSGPCVAFSGSDGTYALSGLAPGASTLSITKTGYAAASTGVTMNGQDGSVPDVALASQGPVVVAFENPTQTFDSVSGGATRSVAAALAPLRTALGSAGFTVQDDAGAPAVRVVVCPTAEFASPQTVERLRAFVAGGGKLVLLGEWGGALRYNPEALNRIATPLGLAFHPDLVRSSQNAGSPGWVLAGPSGPMPAVDAMPAGITLFESSSIFVLPSASGIAYAGSGGYRVAALGADGPCMAAAQSYGAGMVVGVGDTSAWTAGSIAGKSLPNGNLDETNNREFMLNLFRW